MNKKEYRFEGGIVEVLFQEGSVHIVNDTQLWALLEGKIKENTTTLVAWIVEQYRQLQGRDLAITGDSLAVEIWGHVYFEYYLLILKELVRLQLVADLLEPLLAKSDVIDCGETGYDNNRKLWDMLAPHKDFILGMLPGKIDPAQKEGSTGSPPA
ncbi:hypothetical protein [Taibaiella chishuiensis]|nr:hypothetical protein [Taibaiella chishuiensis]